MIYFKLLHIKKVTPQSHLDELFRTCPGIHKTCLKGHSATDTLHPEHAQQWISSEDINDGRYFLKRSSGALSLQFPQTSLVAQTVKRLSTMQETRVQSLGWEDPLEKEMATHSSTVAWKIPWTEEPGKLQPMGSQRVGHDWATSLTLYINPQNLSWLFKGIKTGILVWDVLH